MDKVISAIHNYAVNLTVWVDFFRLSNNESLASLQVHMSLCFSSDAFKSKFNNQQNVFVWLQNHAQLGTEGGEHCSGGEQITLIQVLNILKTTLTLE